MALDESKIRDLWEAVDWAAAMDDERRRADALDRLIQSIGTAPETEDSGEVAYLLGYAHYVHPRRAVSPAHREMTRRWFERALELSPGDALSQMYLGHHYYDTGDTEQSREWFARADPTALDRYMAAKLWEMRVCVGLRARRPEAELALPLDALIEALTWLSPIERPPIVLANLIRDDPRLGSSSMVRDRLLRIDAISGVSWFRDVLGSESES